ncbi:Uncharacterised protein [Vibrio cholerae]|nr:Uncharacterised protein [Vibrio cholerae]
MNLSKHWICKWAALFTLLYRALHKLSCFVLGLIQSTPTPRP